MLGKPGRASDNQSKVHGSSLWTCDCRCQFMRQNVRMWGMSGVIVKEHVCGRRRFTKTEFLVNLNDSIKITFKLGLFKDL